MSSKKYIASRNYWPSGKYFLKDEDDLLLATFEVGFFSSANIKLTVEDQEYQLIGREVFEIQRDGITLAAAHFSTELSRNYGRLVWGSHSISFKPDEKRSRWSFFKGSYCTSFCLEQEDKTVGYVSMPNIRKFFSGKAQWDRELLVPEDWPLFVVALLFYACGMSRDS